jgi:hypothetical protein
MKMVKPELFDVQLATVGGILKFCPVHLAPLTFGD